MCTAGNLGILLVCCSLLAVVSVGGAAVLGFVGLGLIWLRGYLIPYTPSLTAALLGILPWGSTQKTIPERGSLADGTGGMSGEEILETLVGADVLVATEESVAPTDEFRIRWDEEMASLRELDEIRLAAAVTDASPVTEKVEFVETDGRQYLVLSDGTETASAESWIRRPTAIAQAAAVRVLDEFGIPSSQGAVVAVSLGMFLTECPVCETALTEEAASGCCGPPQTTADGTTKSALICAECRTYVHIFE